jgi:hypothetical protein
LGVREVHPVFDSNVPRDAVIWRYYDLPKFIAMLQSKALYFSRANLLGDPLEGSFTQAREAERQRLLANPPKGMTREHLLGVFKHNAGIFAETPWTTYINCWHLGDHESMAMWQGYGGGSYGVAIRSTFAELDAVLPDTAGDFPMSSIYLGRVQYIDHASETMRLNEEANSYAPFVYKSIAYQHESEIKGGLHRHEVSRSSRCAVWIQRPSRLEPSRETGHYFSSRASLVRIGDRRTLRDTRPSH